ncbi:MAG: tetratricopeptide repeat protein [Rubricoccaceae bacterium]|nr:tetratricopeptide repeat protein [Rubricoccaceae bacterium]
MARLVLLALLPLAGCAAFADGAAEGRRGNEALGAGDLEAAAAAFRDGIAATEASGDPAVRGALWNNLGLVLYQQGAVEDAAEAFDEALAQAADAGVRARYAYHAGTAHARAGALEEGAARLRRALVARPDLGKARFNYEWVRRRLDDPPGSAPPPPEPSDAARRLKARADALVAQRQYRDAYDLMNDGMARDSTVAAYAGYIQRLGDIVQIEERTLPSPPDSLR